MTNREWILEEMKSMSDEELAKMIDFCVFDFDLHAYEHKTCEKMCEKCIINWFNQEHKELIKLSEAERTILENIDEKYKWLARDEDNEIWVYEVKPEKGKEVWCSVEDMRPTLPFNHLFQCIKWEDDEPYNIEELLK